MTRFRINKIIRLAVLLVGCLWATNSYAAQIEPSLENAEAASETLYLPAIASFRAPPQVEIVPYVTGFPTDNTITDITHAGNGRLYVVERRGQIYIVEPDGTLLPTPFLDIQDRISTNNWELGLLSLAFHPNYPATPQFFVTYTRKTDFKIIISRFDIDPGNLDQAPPANETVLMALDKVPDVNKPSGISPVHNGGDLNFGTDGYLYVAFGDGGPDPNFGSTIPHDPANNGQRTDLLLGKLIRIDVNPNTIGNLPPNCSQIEPVNYSIPPDNPYVGKQGCNEMWATGFRNPWRVSFDSLTGDMYIGDVGEWIYEEVDFIPAGESDYNFGWRCWEGTFDQTAPGDGHPEYDSQCGTQADYDFPIFEYDGAGAHCAITGGFVYRGSVYDELQGYYILADFCTGEIWLLKHFNNAWAAFPGGTTGFLISTFGEGFDGELYAGGFQNGTLYKVIVP